MPATHNSRRPRRAAGIHLAAAIAGMATAGPAHAQTAFDVIGVTQLNAFDPTIDGAGVIVAQTEADLSGTNTFEVDPGDVDQPASLFTYVDDFGNVSTTYNSNYQSSHADAVAASFYGLTGNGVAPGVAHVDNYSAQFFDTVTLPDLTPIPDAVMNQSFILNEPNNAPLTVADQEMADTQYDNYVDEYGTIFVSAAGNGGMYPNVNAPATMYNGIGVGDADGSESVGPTIDNGRSKPDITAPASETSFSTPDVSGSVTDLLQAARRGDGGNSPTLESEAADERTIKALLLNGANKTIVSFNRTPTAPLDPVNGAGMVNVFNSYLQLAAGQHSASSVVNTANLGGSHAPVVTGSSVPSLDGWDFSTLTTSPTNDQFANYVFAPSAGFSYTFTATLVWNRQFNNNPSVPLGVNNLDLYLYNVTTDTLIDSSVSTVDNVQDVYDQNLPGGDVYDLEVLKNGGTPGTTSGVISNSETYALAFNFAAPTTIGVWDAAGASWTQSGSWALGAIPQNAGDTAMFGAVNGTPCTVTLDAAETVGVLIFKSTNSYTLAPGNGGVLYMDSPTGSAAINDEGGTHTISAPAFLSTNTTVTVVNSTDTLVISGDIGGNGSLTELGAGTLTLAGANSYSGATAVSAGTMQIAAARALPSTTTLTVGTTTSTGTVQLATSGGPFTLAGLAVSAGSTMDLTNNTLLINYGVADPIASIVSYLSDGYAAGWGAGQISSSTVGSLNASQRALIYDIGYTDGADGLTGLSSGQIEILPTLAGDAKLQGNVVFGDFQLLTQYFGQAGGWDEGNFTYSPTIDFGDFQMLAQNFGANSSGLTPQEVTTLQNFASQFGEQLRPNPDGVGFTIVSVPEPAAVGLLAMTALGAFVGRKRRSLATDCVKMTR